MSLLRLLTTGKSLVGLKKPQSRYHLPGEKGLPKFGGKKNPFRATIMPGKGEKAQDVGRVPREVSPVAAAVAKERNQVQAVAAQGTAGKELPRTVKETHKEATQQQGKTLAGPVRGMVGHRAFHLWGLAKRARPSGARAAKPMVQGELSLDRIMVVRNDLSESDLEVVRTNRQAGPKAQTGSLSGAAVNLTSSEVGWGAVAGRLLALARRDQTRANG